MDERLSRKLAAILYADVVEHGVRPDAIDDAARRTLRRSRNLIALRIREYGGRVFRDAERAVLAEFDTALGALACAVAIQSELAERNTVLPVARRVQFRIGVNLGEVTVDQGEIHGNGVTGAERLQRLAEPGEISISKVVRAAVGARLDIRYEEPVGRKGGNTSESPRAGCVVVQPDGETEESEESEEPQPTRAIAPAIVVLFAGAVLTAWLWPGLRTIDPAETARMTFALPPQPSVAVLPFRNVRGHADEDYLVDGLTDDLIARLSALSGIFVIARDSMFAYRGQTVAVSQVAEQLGVRYVLEGDVRRAGARLRIDAQLLDVTAGEELWAERYEGTLTTVFELQNRIVREITAPMQVRPTDLEKVLALKPETNVPSAYDSFLKGWAYYRRQASRDFSQARAYFEHALELDRNYYRAAAALAALYWESHIRDRPSALGSDHDGVRQAATRYLDLAMHSPTPPALLVASDMLLHGGRHEEALELARRALELAAGDPGARLQQAKILVFAGKPREAMDLISSVERLDPHGGARQRYVRGLAEFGMARFDNAAEAIEEALRIDPGWTRGAMVLAAAYGHLQRKRDAEVLLEESWGSDLAAAVTRFPYRREADRNRLAEGLRLGGM